MKDLLKFKYSNQIILLSIFTSAFLLRLYGLNWDANQHLHPDERFLTMVVQAISWPSSIVQYLNPNISTLNPYNQGYDFFVYGTLPIKITKYFSEIITLNQYMYNNITLVGRLLSAIFDLGTVLIIYKFARLLFNKKVGFWASFFYAFSVLPIQLSHFFAVDTFLVFFLTLSFLFSLMIINSINPSVVFVSLGVSFGLALGTKIAALIFLPIIILAIFYWAFKNKKLGLGILAIGLFLSVSYITLRLADPRIFSNSSFLFFSPNPKFISNIAQLNSLNDPVNLFPPGIQWIKTLPIIFPLKNIILWGLGIPLSILSLFALADYSIYSIRLIKGSVNNFKIHIDKISAKQFGVLLTVFWILILFIYQGTQFSKNMRYFLPIYPFLAILTASFITKAQKGTFKKIGKKATYAILGLIIFSILLWPLSFISIYKKPHSRIQASEWIYNNIPPGSIISCEHWDDCLPLPLSGKTSSIFKTETLDLYSQDTQDKWEKINSQLNNIDYLILSSNRLWGSIPKVPKIYPATAQFYEELFAGNLSFQKIAEFTSYPTISILNIQIPDDDSEESFTVYDHPKVIIFQNTSGSHVDLN